MKNGELLRQAQAEFDIFVTMDQGLQYQQNISGFNISIIVLIAASNRLADLLPLMPLLQTAIISITPGEVRRVSSV